MPITLAIIKTALYRINISIIYLNQELRTLKTLLENHFGNIFLFLSMLLNTYLQGGRNCFFAAGSHNS